MSPQQIHEIGLAEVKRIRAEMDQGHRGGRLHRVASRTSSRSSAQLRSSSSRTPPSLLTAYRDIAKRADPELAPLFGRLPQSPYGVNARP